MTRQAISPSVVTNTSAPERNFSRLDGWPMRSPADAFAAALTDGDARLGADADRYSFIATDLHRLLLAGLPAHW